MNEEKYGEDNESNNNQNLSGVSGSKSKGKGNEKKDQHVSPKKDQHVSPKQMVDSFMEFRHRFKTYHMQFCLLESLNIFTLLLSILVCL